MVDMPIGSTSVWTSEEISARLGISTAVFRGPLRPAQIAQIREAGITRIEISVSRQRVDYHSAVQVSGIRNECERQGIAVVSVHGSSDLAYRSEDEAERQQVVEDSLEAIRFAVEMGASVYGAHFGFGDQARKTVADLLEQTDGLNIKLTTENQMGQDLGRCRSFVEAVGSDRFGLVVDIGHARDPDGTNPFTKKSVARKTMAQCGRCVFHVHLHETFDLDQKPDHRPPLHPDGIIEWGEVFAALKDIDYTGELVFEDGRGEDPDDWIRHTAEFPETFARRFGTQRAEETDC